MFKGETTTYVLRVAVRARQRALGPLHPGFDINGIIHDGLCKLLPENAHKMCSGRLHVSLTRVSDGKNVLLSQFESREHLVEALKCSCFIPFYSGLRPPKINGVAYMDGGFSDNQPSLDENTVTVSPFAGDSDICPIDDSYNLTQINFSNTSISPVCCYKVTLSFFYGNLMSELYTKFFRYRFLPPNDMISCTSCLAVQSSFVMAAPEASPDLSTDSDAEQACDNCHSCKQRQQLALTDSLPETIVRAIQDASDQLNKGVINWLFRHRPMKLLSILTIPYVLPIDITIVVICKMWQLLPKMRREIRRRLMRTVGVARDFTSKLQSKHPLYSARFSCQLNITEFNYTPDEPEPRPKTPTGPPPRRVPAPMLRHDLRSRSLEDLVRGNPRLQQRQRVLQRKSSYAGMALPRRTGSEDTTVVSSLNFGFTMNLSGSGGGTTTGATAAGPQGAVVGGPVERCRRQSVVEALRTLSEDREEDATVDAIALTNQALNWEKECIERCQSKEDADKLEHILDVTQQKDALMAFYYTDSTTHRVRVTEIFNVTDTAPNSRASSPRRPRTETEARRRGDCMVDTSGPASSRRTPPLLRMSPVDEGTPTSPGQPPCFDEGPSTASSSLTSSPSTTGNAWNSSAEYADDSSSPSTSGASFNCEHKVPRRKNSVAFVTCGTR
ncbi:hypothetical protein HPB52_015188 [Rhipicephalus sanguineus]|uniref:PNPLA domain-containing protein n=1 Tax=Rhipicephalus sanguineus TaxID=34632 RepID=A0A9D4Q6I0_RHISA|nr:hypothetical protein HPB52_015188 [Rhipicephalus sanguineus]